MRQWTGVAIALLLMPGLVLWGAISARIAGAVGTQPALLVQGVVLSGLGFAALALIWHPRIGRVLSRRPVAVGGLMLLGLAVLVVAMLRSPPPVTGWSAHAVAFYAAVYVWLITGAAAAMPVLALIATRR